MPLSPPLHQLLTFCRRPVAPQFLCLRAYQPSSPPPLAMASLASPPRARVGHVQGLRTRHPFDKIPRSDLPLLTQPVPRHHRLRHAGLHLRIVGPCTWRARHHALDGVTRLTATVHASAASRDFAHAILLTKYLV
ncbi:hypothetical protein E2562_008321 [Oryza meyeriana var. granulata]|uniref:Uncharacterized protein n=1 Tax=Oryza meyeriana var. granulata TaxID=110450 RepID=A0A6G1DFP8_9ORYZ|nr:hypothetical protein E2562_008321 [Oryza meyeriana var. granulata]